MDVDALIRHQDGNKRKQNFRGTPNSSPKSLYRKGYLGELQNVNYNTYDSFWGLGLAKRTIEPQYVPPKKSMEIPKKENLSSPPMVETRTVVNAK
jgi:hypothetical protein